MPKEASLAIEKDKDKDVLENMDKVIHLAKATKGFKINHTVKNK